MAKSAEEYVKEADALLEGREFQKILDILIEGHKEHPNDIEIWWRLARAYFDIAEQSSDNETKKAYFQKGLVEINGALAADDKHFATHKWWAILTSSLGEFLSTKEKIENAYKIKEHSLKALELQPSDPTTLHMLGRWCFSVANISWIERTAASALFGTPPSSTFDEALGYFLKAQELAPDFIRNAVFIGDCYANLKQNSKAKEWYQKASQIVAHKPADQKYVDEAKTKANKY